jgi:hypothetical protein
MATLARWQRTITTGGGIVLPGASVEVRRESDNGLATLFSDRAGTVSILNPFLADSQGFAAFHVVGGAYKIVATYGSSTLTWRYVGIGMTQEFDVDQLSLTYVNAPDVPDGNVVGRPLGAGTGDPQALTSTQQFANSTAAGSSLWGPGRQLSISTTPVNLTAADSGKHVISGNASRTVNLPASAAGLCYSFGQFGTGVLTVTAPSGLIIYPNGSNGTTLQLTTSTGFAMLVGDGANWFLFGCSLNTTQVLAATAQEGAVRFATAAEYWANTPLRGLDNNDVWSAAGMRGLTDAATVAVDMSQGINFTLTIGGNRTLGNPTNTKDGQTGAIVVTQDGTGNRTLVYAANWEFAAGVAPTLSTAANAKDVMFYFVNSSTSIVITGILKGVV